MTKKQDGIAGATVAEARFAEALARVHNELSSKRPDTGRARDIIELAGVTRVAMGRYECRVPCIVHIGEILDSKVYRFVEPDTTMSIDVCRPTNSI